MVVGCLGWSCLPERCLWQKYNAERSRKSQDFWCI